MIEHDSRKQHDSGFETNVAFDRRLSKATELVRLYTRSLDGGRSQRRLVTKTNADL
jgi:hypothetical protein